MVPLLISFIILLSWLSSSSADLCDEHMDIRGPRMMAMMNGTYPSCRDVDLSSKLAVCELGNDDDVTSLYGSTYIRANLHACPDGSSKKVCYPRIREGFDLFYSCVCRSGVQYPENVTTILWSSWEEITPPVEGVYYAIRLMIDGGECITREFILNKPIISGFGLPDSVFTASSNYNAINFPHQARFGAYFVTCGWNAHPSDTEPWLAITLPAANYAISGVLIKKRCTIPEHFVKRVTISTSVDDVTWQDVIADEDLAYGSDILAGVWFSAGYTARYWKIIAKVFAPPHASMKCDLIGKALI